MDKKSKEALRRYKKSRAAAAASSSDSSSSSDSESGSSSGSYSSSSSDKKPGHRKKKGRGSTSSGDERRKREKAHSCHQKKLEAKRNHLKRKLREAKAAKKRSLSASVIRRRPGSASPSKMKILGEKKHVRATSKERLRHGVEREKLRARERERIQSRSPRSLAKLEAKLRARKSPVQTLGRHQLSPREKIIIQTRTRERTPERKRELKMRLDDSRERERRDRERVEREAERQKEREEALARCQERQRERERLAREKLRREKEKEYVVERVDRLIPRPAEREIAIAVARGYGSRERSLEEDGRVRHGHTSRIRDPAYERERDYLAAEHHRGPVLERDERREREYLMVRRREALSPGHYRDDRELYSEEERAAYARAYAEEERRCDRNWDPRELGLLKEREIEKLYPARRVGEDWPEEDRWEEKNWGRGAKSTRPPSEPDWDAEDYAGGSRQLWEEAREKRDRERALDRVQSPSRSGRWPPQEWRGSHSSAVEPSAHRKGSNYRHGGPHGQLEFLHDRQKFRPHPPPLMAIHSGYHPPRQFPSKRQMTYTNPNLKKKIGPIPTTPGGTAIPSLLALPPIPPPDTITTPTEEHAPTIEAEELAMQEEVKIPEESAVEQKSEAPTTSETDRIKMVADVETEIDAITEAPATEPVVATTTEEESIETALISGPKVEETPTAAPITTDEPSVDPDVVPDDLSEISDSDDEILDKEEETKSPVEALAGDIVGELPADTLVAGSPLKDIAIDDSKPEAGDDDLLDFEEISDGELEEDSRVKGVGDALGVDWASLVKEAKIPLSPPLEQTTAKQKWQAHRIVLDVGISLKMAGEDFGKHLLIEAKDKLNEELGEVKKIKLEIKDELMEDSTNEAEDAEDTKKVKLQIADESGNGDVFDLRNLQALACAQIGQRVRRAERRNLIIGACGPNSRALSARHDLKLRRQLCGLPRQECDFRRPVNEKIKAMALALFQRTLEVK